jgi:hypothetical protein
MKTIIRTAFIAFAAIAAVLTGCSKENPSTETETGTDERSVFMKIDIPETRAPGHHVEDNSDVVVGDACIYFTNGINGVISHVVIDFANPSDPYKSSTKTVGIATAKAGFEVASLPGSVTRVSVVGNMGTGYNYAAISNISQIDPSVTVLGQYDTAGGVANVTLFGRSVGAFTAVAGQPGKYTTKVVLEPVGSRLEVGRITATNTAANVSNIKSFTVGGIFINNYYGQMAIDGSSASAITDNGSTESNYTASYYATNAAALIDETAFFALDDATTYGPVTGADVSDVWGYNLLAPSFTTPAAPVAPHIVVKIQDVVIEDGTALGDAVSYAGEWWLTVRNFYDNGVKITSLDNGYVYRIKSLAFNESNLTELPEMNTIDLKVEVTPIKWTSIDVAYDWQ